MLIEVKRRDSGKTLYINPRNVKKVDGPATGFDVATEDEQPQQTFAVFAIISMSDGEEIQVEGSPSQIAKKIGVAA